MITGFFRRIFPLLARQKRPGMAAGNNASGREKNDPGSRLVWVDCEMTGLSLEDHRLVEIACIVSEADLTAVAEFGPVAIKQPPEVMDNMSDWCKQTFAKNGLLDRIKASCMGEKETVQKLLDFLQEHTPKGQCPLAGNSVHQDRQFLRKYMPQVCEYLHPYRIVDVSTLKELVKRWYGGTEALQKMPEKRGTHLALDDIRESIGELQYYREHFFLNVEK